MRRSKPLRSKTRIKPVSDKKRSKKWRAKHVGSTLASFLKEEGIEPVRSTTARSSTPPVGKDGHLLCEAYLDFVRRLPCYFCAARQPSQAHHWPPRGRGVTRDDRVIPVCLDCHNRCHGIGVPFVTIEGKRVYMDRWNDQHQDEAVLATRDCFMEQADEDQWQAYCVARADWWTGRIWVQP